MRIKAKAARPTRASLVGLPALLERIVPVVCEYYQLTPDKLWTKTKQPAIAWPRQIVLALLREGGFPLESIARLTGKHHATVMYAVHMVKELTTAHPDIKADVEWIRERVKEGAC